MNVVLKMVDDSNDTYIFFNIDDKKIIAENKIAKSYFTFIDEDINSIFVNENSIIDESIERLQKENLAYFWDVEIRYSNDKHEKADIQIGYADDDLKSLFISIKTNSFDKFLQMRKFVDLSNKPIFVLTQTNDDYKVYYANDYFYSTIGVDIDKFKDSYDNSFTKLLVDEKRQDYIEEIKEALIDDVEYATDIEIENEKGERFWFFFDLYKISNAYGDNMLYATLIAHSKHIDVLNNLKDQLNQEKKYFTTMQELSHDIMFKIDVKNKLLINEPLEAEKFGVSPVIHNFPESIINQNILHPDDEEECVIFTKAMMRGESSNHKMRIRRVHPITNAICFEWFELDTKCFKDDKGEIVEIIGKLTNIQDIISLELKASRDDLTGAYNKLSFREHIIEFFENESKESNENLQALLFVDLDDFKYVNDTFGHSYGDYLLKSVVERLQNSIRTDDFLGRVGGDEFVILIKNVPSVDIIKPKLDTIFEKLREPFVQNGISHIMSISIGIALYPKNSTNYDELYNLADSALYYSKNNGKNLATFYDDLDY